MKQKLLSMLVLLVAVATGAWAQTETLLTTITPTGDESYSETTPGVVSVTPINEMGWYDEEFGWCWTRSGSVTVEAKEGYTITRCVFKQNEKNPVTITTSPFAITFADGHCEQNYDMDGVTSIEVYGPAAPATTYSVTLKDGTDDATNWKAKVGNGELQALPLTGLTGDGTETVTITYNGTKRVKGVTAVKKAAVSFTEVTTFSELQTALSAGKNVKLMNDIVCTEGIEITSNGVTIDGNGKKLTLNMGISLASGATLTIQGNGTMNVNGTNNSKASTVAGSTGTLILTSGTLTAKGGNGAEVDVDEMGADYRAYAGGNAINGNVTVSGGTLTAIGGNGGSIGDYSSGAYGADGGVAISGSVTVTDGTVTATGGNGGSIGADASGANGGSGGAAIGGNATISGGTWTATNGTNGGGGGGAGGKAVAGTVTDNR